jgi:hypothetical protein
MEKQGYRKPELKRMGLLREITQFCIISGRVFTTAPPCDPSQI